MAGPYQMTPLQGAQERRRAAVLRALSGLAERGPALGVDPFGSFQAGLGGALKTGEDQRQQLFREQLGASADEIARMRTQNEYDRIQQDPTTDRIHAIETRLGRSLTDDEIANLFSFNKPEGSRTLQEKVNEFVNVYKRQPNQTEMSKLAGTWVDPGNDPENRLRGQVGQIYDYGLALGIPMGTPEHPDTAGFQKAQAAWLNSQQRGNLTYNWDPIFKSFSPQISGINLTPESLQKMMSGDPMAGLSGALQGKMPPLTREQKAGQSLDHAMEGVLSGQLQPDDLEMLHSVAQDSTLSEPTVRKARNMLRLIQGGH